MWFPVLFFFFKTLSFSFDRILIINKLFASIGPDGSQTVVSVCAWDWFLLPSEADS